MNLLYGILENLSLVSSLIPLLLLFFIRPWKPGRRIILRLLFCLVSLEVVTESLCKILAHYKVNNQIIIHLYTVCIAVIIFLLYRKYIKSRAVLAVGTGLLVLFFIVACGEFLSNFDVPNTYSYSLLSVLCIFLSLALFFQMINDLSIKNIWATGQFWINSAILFYFGTTFCLTLFETYIHLENPDVFMYTWPIQLISNIILHLTLSKGIWQTNRA